MTQSHLLSIKHCITDRIADMNHEIWAACKIVYGLKIWNRYEIRKTLKGIESSNIIAGKHLLGSDPRVLQDFLQQSLPQTQYLLISISMPPFPPSLYAFSFYILSLISLFSSLCPMLSPRATAFWNLGFPTNLLLPHSNSFLLHPCQPEPLDSSPLLPFYHLCFQADPCFSV